jgi:hypothetical protein
MKLATRLGRSSSECLRISVASTETPIEAAAKIASRGRRRTTATAATRTAASSSEPIETIRRKLSACAAREAKKSWPTKECSSRRCPQ